MLTSGDLSTYCICLAFSQTYCVKSTEEFFHTAFNTSFLPCSPCASCRPVPSSWCRRAALGHSCLSAALLFASSSLLLRKHSSAQQQRYSPRHHFLCPKPTSLEMSLRLQGSQLLKSSRAPPGELTLKQAEGIVTDSL